MEMYEQECYSEVRAVSSDSDSDLPDLGKDHLLFPSVCPVVKIEVKEEPYDIDALNNVKCDAGIDDRVCVVGDNILQKAPACAAGARDKRSSELHQNQLQHDGGMASEVCSKCRVPIGKRKRTVTLRKIDPCVCSQCIVKSIGAKSQNFRNRKLCNEELTKDHSVNPVKKIYQCNLCNVQFSTNCHLKRHAVTHTIEYQFTCDVCSKRFSQLPSLKRHTVIHSGEKPFVCEVCSKSFSQLGNLKRHSVTHTGERPFMCRVCSKRFSLSSHLKEHFVMHTGQKPYVCDMCSKRFSRLTTLRRHSITHTGEKPFACSVCNKRFSLLFNLKKHTLKFCNIPPDRLI